MHAISLKLQTGKQEFCVINDLLNEKNLTTPRHRFSMFRLSLWEEVHYKVFPAVLFEHFL